MVDTNQDTDYYVPKVSCTIDEAVFYLIGWIPRPEITLVFPPIPGEEQYHCGVLELLADNCESYEAQYQNAIDEEHSAALIEVAKETCGKAERIKNFAQAIYSEIKNELLKGDKSSFVIDPESKKPKTNPYITLASLDPWSRKKYGVAFLAEVDIDDGAKASVDKKIKPPRTKQTEQQQLILLTLKQLALDPLSLPPVDAGLSGVRKAVRTKIGNNELFKAKTSYRKAWQALLNQDQIGYSSNPTLKK